MNLLRRLLDRWRCWDRLNERLAAQDQEIERLREAVGRIESHCSAARAGMALSEHEFRVFSQWGEDGIIDHLVRHVPVARRFFVEFGVEDYREANTRFLLMQGGWSGLVLDGCAENIARLRTSPLMWRHHLEAVAAFITRENINGLIEQHGGAGDIGLLSIDVDGMDYWLWEAIDVCTPAIVVVEYNALFGVERAVTVPYAADFQRGKAHYSNLYAGASLAALVRLGTRKGYSFVGTNRAGNNAFFVRRELRPQALPELSARDGFTPTQFREARAMDGSLSLISAADAARLIEGLPLVEIPE
jgi:hypothetical protein